jgi:hypothetical protein
VLAEQILHLEEKFEKDIAADAAPFLSLLGGNISGNEPDIWNKLNELFSILKRVEMLENFMDSFPALITCYLTHSVSQNLQDHFRIWPYIEKSFGLPETTEPQRERIWHAFRKACQRLNLPVLSRTRGTHYIVNEFLHHTGVPQGQVDALARKMLQLAQKIGLPDPDDTDNLRIWQDELLNTLKPPFPITAKKGLELDSQAYYSKLFVLAADENLDENNFFQKAIQSALQKEQQNFRLKQIQFAPPKIIIRDDFPCLMLPRFSEGSWRVAIDGKDVQHEALTEGGVVPLEQIPHNIEAVAPNNRTWSLPFWHGEENNQMCLFGERDMRLLPVPISFGEDRIVLPPGDYKLLSRFEPNQIGSSVEKIQDTPDIYCTCFTLTPSSLFKIRKGPALLTIEAEAVPFVRFLSPNALYDAEGKLLYPSAGLTLEIILPEELRGKHLSISVKSRHIGTIVTLDIKPDGKEVLHIDLGKILESFEPCVSLINVQCCMYGTARNLASSAVVVWNGLQEAKLGKASFYCSQLPTNFNQNASRNSTIIESNTIQIKEQHYKDWTTVFDDGSKIIHFLWVRPGRAMRIRAFSNAAIIETPLAVGSPLVVENSTNKILYVLGLGEGKIILGDNEWSVKAGISQFRLPIANIIDAVTAYSNTLYYKSANGLTEEALLRVVEAYYVVDESVKINFSEKYQSFECLLQRPVKIIYVKTINLFTGAEDVRAISPCNTEEELKVAFSNGAELGIHFGGEAIKIYVDQDISCSDGLWLVSIEGEDGTGRWRLTNERQDYYAWTFAVRDGGFTDPYNTLQAEYSSGDSARSMPLLMNLNTMVLRCYSGSVWEKKLEWIKFSWIQLTERALRDAITHEHSPKELLKLIDCKPPHDAHAGWVPLVGLSTQFPMLLAQPASWYSSAPQGDSAILRALENIASLTSDSLSLPTSLERLHPSFALTIHNCKPFNIAAYRQAWVASDIETERYCLSEAAWKPSIGDTLGPLHFRYAVQHLTKAMERAEAGESNPFRRDWANLLAGRGNVPSLLVNTKIGSRQDWQDFLSYIPAPSDEIQEQLSGKIALIASYALLCRQQSYKNIHVDEGIRDYLGILQHGSMNNEQAKIGLHYLLIMGEELLGFFLLFWDALFQKQLLNKYTG